jgi:hypothetical protein
MPEITDQDFTPDFSRELNIENLISAPLVAVSKANVIMAQGQTRFLLEYCFTKKGEYYEPVMIQMAVTRSPVNLNQAAPKENSINPQTTEVGKGPPIERLPAVTAYFHLPLLTIVPLNSLAVDKVTIDFDLEVSSANSKPSHTTNESPTLINKRKVQLYGKISYDPGSHSKRDSSSSKPPLSSKIKVNLNATALPLPTGVLSLIDLYTKSFYVVPAVANDQTNSDT